MRTTAFHRPTPLRVAVLLGGNSAEREISLLSGAAVAQALEDGRHRVTRLDPAEHDLRDVDRSCYEAVFIALHGEFGEDGQVQAILETAGVPFTGSDSAASRLAFSKSAAKERLAQHGIATPRYALIHETDDAAAIDRKARSIGYPLVVKPDQQGSSLGVSIASSPDDLPAGLTNCFQYGPFGILEQFIAGEEWTFGLLDETGFPPIRIETEQPFFDYHAKYKDNQTAYAFEPAAMSPRARSIRETGRRAAAAIGTRGLARVDLLVDRHDRPWVLEVNTVPGLTAHSLVPRAAEQMGIGFRELCERSLQSCRPLAMLAKAG